jgi:excisionase family DNA binding protein
MSATETTTTETSRRGLLLIDAQEVARRLGLSERTVWRLTAAGKLPNPIRIGGKTKRWRAEDIRAWVAAGCPDRLAWESLPRPRLDGASGSDGPRVAVGQNSEAKPPLG